MRAPILSILVAVAALPAGAGDLAIVNGRVIDPESGTDAVRHVLIDDGRIVQITEAVPESDEVIDATGLVVAPGFIDLHAHGQDPVSNRFQAADGVTTALELEIGGWPVRDYYASREGTSLLNYGATVSHVVARYAAVAGLEDLEIDYDALSQQAFGNASARRPISDEQIDYALQLLGEGMREGALGFGFGITYTPGATHDEIFRAFSAAAELEAPAFVHVRAAERVGGDRLAPIQEIVANAAATGASAHIVHLNSSTGESAQAALRMIRSARKAGVDVSTESYPYAAGATLIESAIFDDWQRPYETLQWAATGERLTQETFAAFRQLGGIVIIHGRSEAQSDWLIAQPDVIVASDGISFANGPSHPRGAGTYSRVLGRHVRQREALDLVTALAKMTLLPARRLEAIAPGMKRKGRVQVGADADLTLFDPQRIVDNATYGDSMRFSSGIEYVLVGGTPIVRQGELVDDVFPGQPIYGRLKR